jgi:hypothetical protein
MVMKKLIILVILLATLIACAYVGNATETQAPEPETLPTRATMVIWHSNITPTVSPYLYQDDFAIGGGDWMTQEDEFGVTRYTDSAFRITGVKSEYMNWSILEQPTFDDGILSVTLKKNSGDDNLTGVAIFWRIMDQDNFYFLQVGWNGFYSVYKYLDNQLVEIIPWKQSRSLQLSDAQNTVEIRFSGDTADIYFNGEFVTSMTDDSFPRGNIGLGVFPDPTSEVDVEFTDVTVYPLDAGAQLLPVAGEAETNQAYARVTWKELADFLVRDHTNWKPYDAKDYNCMDYAIDLVNNARAENIKSWIVGVDFISGETGHAFVAFDTSDRGVIFVEPQADYTYSNLKVGLDLCDDWGKSACWGVVKKIEYYEMCNHEQYCTEYVP